MKVSYSSCQYAISLLSAIDPGVAAGKYDIRILPVDGEDFESEVVHPELGGIEKSLFCSKEQYWTALENSGKPAGSPILDVVTTAVAQCDWDDCDIVMISKINGSSGQIIETIANYIAIGIEASR